METESFDSKQLYQLDDAIRSTMEAIRRAQPTMGGWGGGFATQGGFGGGQGFNAQQLVDTVRERVVEGVRERVADAVREKI